MLQRDIAIEARVPPSTFSRWWTKGAKGSSAFRAADLLSLWWARKEKGNPTDTYIWPSDLTTMAGFRAQVRKICPKVNEGRGRVKGDSRQKR